MLRIEDILTLVGAIIAAVALIAVVRWRRKDHAVNIHELADEQVCEHLKPALDKILAAGCRVSRVGQNGPEYPLEIHFTPAFDPKAVFEELKLEEPVFLSAERNVIFCKEDWCELHPKP